MTHIINADGSQCPTLSREVLAKILGPWEEAKLQELTRKVIHRLSRMKAAGLFSEYRHTSLWGEYSHHVQNGDFDGLSDGLDDIAADACEAVADTVPVHELHLFDQLAIADGAEAGMAGYSYLVDKLKEEVEVKASVRDLERYSDDYRWYDNL